MKEEINSTVMRNNILKYAVSIAALFSVVIMTEDVARAKVRLPQIISDNMVLQQKSDVNLWGWGSGRVKVSVSWSKTTFTADCAEDGSWKVTVPTPAAGYEPQTVTVSDRDSRVTLYNILIGEVWLCGGQSNMEMPLNGFGNCPVEGSAEEIAASGQWKDRIRQVKLPKTGSLEIQDTVAGRWVVPEPRTARWISAAGWFFARMLNSVLDVPVGILECNWGGSTVESWLPEEIVRSYPENTIPLGEYYRIEPEGWWHCCSSYVMYNAMLYPVHNYTIKGFLWYQGESNAGLNQYYTDRLVKMVSVWRELWGQGDIPFYEVELAPWKYGGDGTLGARQREAQRRAADIIPNSGIVCTNDLVYPYEYDQIHPCRKKEVGYRLAYQALNKTYGIEGIECDGPVYKSMKVDGNKIVVEFDNAGSGFSPWHGIEGFEVAGEDKVFHPAEARIGNNNTVIVSSDEVPSPVAVRYCFRDFQPGNLTGRCNLPVAPFRSDNW